MTNLNSNYGQLDSIFMGANGQAGNTFVVFPNNGSVYSRYSDSFVADDYGFERSFTTIQAAVNAAVSGRGDVIYVVPGFYDETVTVAKNNLTIIGLGGRGATGIEASAAGAEGLQVTGDDVTLINFGVSGDDTSSYALNLNSAARFRAYGCKFEGSNTTVALINGTAADQTADALFSDCEFAWSTGDGVTFDDSAYGFPTEIFFDNCRFHNIDGTHMIEAAGGAVASIEVNNCVFDVNEAGTKPSDYINLVSVSSTGIFTNNSFALATNASADLKISATILWVANKTEAGISAARPA